MNLMVRRGTRYTGIGVATFALDLSLLFLFIDVFNISVLVATGLAFIIALSLNYFLSREYVFAHSSRTISEGYVYFLAFAILGMFVTVALMWSLIVFTSLSIVVSRIIIAFVVGLGNYFANLVFNFKVSGVEIE